MTGWWFRLFEKPLRFVDHELVFCRGSEFWLSACVTWLSWYYCQRAIGRAAGWQLGCRLGTVC